MSKIVKQPYTTPNPLQSHEAVALHSIWSFNSLFFLHKNSFTLYPSNWLRLLNTECVTELGSGLTNRSVFGSRKSMRIFRSKLKRTTKNLIYSKQIHFDNRFGPTGFILWLEWSGSMGKKTDDPSPDPQHLSLTICTVFTYTVQIELVTRDNCCDNIGKCIRPTDCMHYC